MQLGELGRTQRHVRQQQSQVPGITGRQARDVEQQVKKRDAEAKGQRQYRGMVPHARKNGEKGADSHGGNPREPMQVCQQGDHGVPVRHLTSQDTKGAGDQQVTRARQETAHDRVRQELQRTAAP
jgi:hypothetical protein